MDGVLIYRGGAAEGGPGPSAPPPGPALASVDGGEVVPTPLWTDYYGEVELPVGAVMEAYDPDGVLCGVYTIRTEGQYGFLHVYGDDAATPLIDEGASPGDVITFMHNGVVLATALESLVWTGTKDVLNLNTNGALGLDGSGDGLPETYALGQNYPNPFNPITVIPYQLPEAGFVSLSIYNLLGKQVANLVTESRNAGYHQAVWHGTDDRGRAMPSGIYLVRIDIGEHNGDRRFSLVRKTILLK